MKPDFSLAGRRALVTGGSRGIGQAVAIGYAAMGAAVAVTSRSGQSLDETRDRIRALGGTCVPVVMDLTSVDSIRRGVEHAETALGPLDILVNNAGMNIAQPALEATEEAWDTIFATNLKGLFFCSQEVARRMVPRGGGVIVVIGSIFQEVARAGRVVYATSKGAISTLMKGLALEWAPLGIRINAVGPSYTSTAAVTYALKNPDFKADVERRTPLGRVANVEDMVGAAVFLASPAAAYMTGQTIFVDGGWLAQ